MRLHKKLSLLAIPLLTVFLLASVPLAGAMEHHRDWDKDKDKKPYSMPEGSGSAIVALAAGALGGALLLSSRSKRRATTAA